MSGIRIAGNALIASAVLMVLPLTAAGQSTVPLKSSYGGLFSLAFGAGPNGTDDLRFAGFGKASHLGKSMVLGHSTTLPDPTEPGCSDIVTDLVVLLAANGDELWLQNSGEDCLDFSIPGRLFIRGSGTFMVTGGTGRFEGAMGQGEFNVVAEVLGSDAGGVSGAFQLSFTGEISRRVR
jgi:hypothetical protein